LVNKGIALNRLPACGFGIIKSMADNKTVELRIVFRQSVKQ
jgi:hypothetical protein